MDKFTIGNMVYSVKDGKAFAQPGGTTIPDSVPRTITPKDAGLDVGTMKPGDEVEVDGYTYVVDEDDKIILKEEDVPISIESYYDNIIKDDMKNDLKDLNIEFSTIETGVSFTTSNSDDFRSFIGSFADGSKDNSGQVTYADAIISAANDGLIPEGSLVKFNYGKASGEAGYAIYHDGKLQT